MAPFASAHNVLRVCDRGRPVEALVEGFSDQRPWLGVVAAYASVDLLEHLLPLHTWDALLQDSRHAPLVEGTPDHDVRLGMTCEVSHLCRVDGEDPSCEVV
jgi:hypothetical protein